VPWHTGDYNLDQIYPNSEVCPRLDTLEDSIYNTQVFQTENSTQAQQQLNSALDVIWGAGYWDWYNVYDCLMTTVCTDRPLPDGTAEVPMNEAIFNATVAQAQYTMSFLNTYNHSQWAKLAMGNTAWHVRTNIENAIYNTSSSLNSTTPLKLAVFAGHDTTIMPFLAAVLESYWDRKWPGYASLVTIELYEAANSTAANPSYLFRMVYNSKPLYVPGCLDYLCDVQVLLDRLAFGEEYMPCTTSDVTVSGSGCSSSNNDRLSNGDVVLVSFMSALFGAVLGAGIVVFLTKSRSAGLANKEQFDPNGKV
jgi:hypothetical protein